MVEDNQMKRRQLAELEERRVKIREMGGKERVKRQKEQGKLTAR
jgi:acetyl-CoA carboxylase carboxyltransferase component